MKKIDITFTLDCGTYVTVEDDFVVSQESVLELLKALSDRELINGISMSTDGIDGDAIQLEEYYVVEDYTE